MPGWEAIKSFLEQAKGQATRSTAMNPLGWFCAVLLAGLVTMVYAKAPAWLLILLACVFVLCALCYLTCFALALRYKPDVLRSEKFTLSKLAIEHRIGDTEEGFVDGELVDSLPAKALPDKGGDATVRLEQD